MLSLKGEAEKRVDAYCTLLNKFIKNTISSLSEEQVEAAEICKMPLDQYAIYMMIDRMKDEKEEGEHGRDSKVSSER